MKPFKLDKVDEILNMKPFEKETNLPNNPLEEIKDKTVEEKMEDDFELARNAMRDMIDKNNTSIDEIRSISSSSESSRNYRVLGELVKAQSEVAKDLIDLHLQKKDLEKEEKTENYNQTNNIVFAGSTNELMKMISKESEKVIDEPKD